MFPEQEHQSKISEILNNRLARGYFEAITDAVSMEEGLEIAKDVAKEVLRRLPLMEKTEKDGATFETRLIGTFNPEPKKRNVVEMRYMEHLSNVLKDILIQVHKIPTINIDPIEGKWTITIDESILSDNQQHS